MRPKSSLLLPVAALTPFLLAGVVGLHLTHGAWLESRYMERLSELESSGIISPPSDRALAEGPEAEVVRSGLTDVRRLFETSLPPELAGPDFASAVALADRSWTPEQRRRAFALLAPLADAFELAHAVTSAPTALTTLEGERPVVRGEARLLEARRWVTVLAARARLDALSGDQHGAAARLRTGLRLLRLMDEGHLIGSMVRVAGEGVLFDEAQAQLARGVFRGGPLLEVLRDDLTYGPDREDDQRVLRRELAEVVRARPVRPSVSEGLTSFLRYPDECSAMLASLEAWETGLEVAAADAGQFASAQERLQAALPAHDPLGAGMLPSALHGLRRHRSRTALLIVALAAYAHQEAGGSWPERLAELAPLLDGEVPSDPWTGEPFPYERRPVGYVLGQPEGPGASKLEWPGTRWLLR